MICAQDSGRRELILNYDSMEDVKKWRQEMSEKVARYIKMDYAIVTQDESHFKTERLSARFWAPAGRRVLMV